MDVHIAKRERDCILDYYNSCKLSKGVPQPHCIHAGGYVLMMGLYCASTLLTGLVDFK